VVGFARRSGRRFWLLTRLTAKLLYGISATDPVTFIVIALLLLLCVTFAGMLLPGRAEPPKVDPMIALRVE